MRPALFIETGRRWTVASMAMLVFAVSPRAARPQEGAVGTGGVTGVVRDSLGLPVVGAQISLHNSDLRAESDDHGEFRLSKALAGPLTIRVRRIGYRPDSLGLQVLAGKTIPAVITLQRVAVELRAVVVVGRKQLTGHMAGFYERLSHGMGNFLTHEQIDRRNPINMTDLFRMIPGARVETRGGSGRNVVRFRGSRCAPLTWLDGTPLYAGEFDFDSIDPRTLEGVEIYSGPASVPAEFMGSRALSSSCGTVIMWSREGELRPKKRKNPLSAAAEIAQLVESQQVFTASQVEAEARPDSSHLVRPVYPDSLFQYGVPGKVLVEFVVTQGGDVNMDTFNVVTTTHPALTESVRRALKDQMYFPARRQGRAVPQVVQQPFTFVPDSSIVRSRH